MTAMFATESGKQCQRGRWNIFSLMVVAWLVWGGQKVSAESITNVTVVNVTPTGFSVFWRADVSTPSIAVFADAGGLTNLAGQVGIEAFPLHTGNPDLPAGYERRLGAAALRQKTQGDGLMLMRVSGCRPGTTYYFRLTSTPTSGSPEVYPASGPLPGVTTERENTFVANDQQIVLEVPGADSEGRIVLLSYTNAAHPLAAVIGDGVGTNQVFFNVNDLFASAGSGNIAPLGEQEFAVEVLGPNQTDISQTFTLTFTSEFAVAVPAQVYANTAALAVYVGSTIVNTGQVGAVSIIAAANTNLSSIDLTLDIPPGHLTQRSLQSLAPQLDPAATKIVAQGGVRWLLHFAALSGQTFVGSNQLAGFAFTAVANQVSAFVPLKVAGLTGTTADGLPVGQLSGQSGRIVIIGNQPLLEAGVGANGTRQLTLYGKAWMSYAIEASTNLSDPDGWSEVRRFAQTNIVTTLGGLVAPSPIAFYRAMEFTPDPPVLDAFAAPDKTRTLVGYGRPGLHYTLLAKTNLSNIVSWTPVLSYTLTNGFQYVAPPGSGGTIFYRLQRN